MFISNTRIKKLLRNPLGGVAFLIQYIKSLFLKKIKIANIDTDNSDYLFLIDNNSFWKYILSIDLKENNFEFFCHKICLDTINWNYDYLNDFEIKNQYYFNLREWIIKNSFKGFDVKNIWEISRGNYLLERSVLFAQTNDLKFADEYVRLIDSWISQNPYLYSSNWTNPMEVSIRVINWILGYQIISKVNPGFFEDKFKKNYYKNLYESFVFLTNNIEAYPYKTNHYVIDNLGIFVLALTLKNINNKWIKKSSKNLIDSLEKQINSEGVDFENSSNYQLLKLEAWSLFFVLYSQNLTKLELVFKLKEEYLEKLKRVFNFAGYLFKNSDSTFNYGDNDETEIIRLGSLKDKINLFYWILFKNELKSGESKIFNLSGYGFLKSKNINCLFLRSNLKNSSHFHNDLLSFQLNFKGQDFFIDPNTFNYNLNKEKRAYYLSTRRHNTCFINSEEQTRIEENDSFLRNKQKTVCLKKYSINNVRDEMSLELKYKKCTHLRSLVLNKEKEKLTIFDTFDGKINTIEWNFYLPKSINIKSDLNAKNVLVLDNNNNKLVLEFPETLKLEICDACVSEKYNNEEIGKNIKLIYINKQKLNRLSFQIDIKEKYLN